MRHWREPSDLLPFDEVEQGRLDQRTIFAVRTDRLRSQQSGAELDVDRLYSADWVNVIAIADAGEEPFLLCVRQYRFGSQQMSLEIPAGLVDPGEDARTAALRELREETGFVPAQDADVVDLGFCLPNAAFMTNRMTTFFVPHAIAQHDLDLDEHEEIELVKIPLAELDHAIAEGAITNAAVLVGLYAWRRHEGA